MKPKQRTALTALFVACLVCACVIPTRTDVPDVSIGPPDTEIFDDAVLHEFIIEITQEEWEGMSQDMLDYAEKFPIEPFYQGDGREFRTDNYRKADFIYRGSDGTEYKLAQVGVRTRGNESRRLPYQNGRYYKSHFKVKFDEIFDMPANDPATIARSKRRFAGLKVLNFKWSRYNTWDPDPMGLDGYEQKFFYDKTKNVLDQLKIGYAGYEVE
jgi:hypothetical protein